MDVENRVYSGDQVPRERLQLYLLLTADSDSLHDSATLDPRVESILHDAEKVFCFWVLENVALNKVVWVVRHASFGDFYKVKALDIVDPPHLT